MTTALVTGGCGFIGRKTLAALRNRGIEAVPADVAPHPDEPTFHELDVSDTRGRLARGRRGPAGHRRSTSRRCSGSTPTSTRGAASRSTRWAPRTSSTPPSSPASSASSTPARSRSTATRRRGASRRSPRTTSATRRSSTAGTSSSTRRPRATTSGCTGCGPSGLRISTVYGEGRKAGMSAPINKLIEGAASGVGDCPFGENTDSCLIHVEDVAEMLAILATADELQHGLYNAGGDFSTIGELVGWIKEFRPDVKLDARPAGRAHPARLPRRRVALHRRVRLHPALLRDVDQGGARGGGRRAAGRGMTDAAGSWRARRNPLKEAMQRGEPAIAHVGHVAVAAVPEILGVAGIDGVLLDLEHVSHGVDRGRAADHGRRRRRDLGDRAPAGDRPVARVADPRRGRARDRVPARRGRRRARTRGRPARATRRAGRRGWGGAHTRYAKWQGGYARDQFNGGGRGGPGSTRPSTSAGADADSLSCC